jgi:hypothetical protein
VSFSALTRQIDRDNQTRLIVSPLTTALKKQKTGYVDTEAFAVQMQPQMLSWH